MFLQITIPLAGWQCPKRGTGNPCVGSVLWTGGIPWGAGSLQFLLYPSCLDYAEGEHHFGSIGSEINLWRLQWCWNVLLIFLWQASGLLFSPTGSNRWILCECVQDGIEKCTPWLLWCCKTALFQLEGDLNNGKLKSVLSVMSLCGTCSALRLRAGLHLVLFPGIK